jgi:DNA-binding MarR family transcriptional regulator
MAEPAGRDRLKDLPPSCVLVYRMLEESGPMTPTEVREKEPYLASRTVLDALDRLNEADLVETEPADYGQTTRYSV